MKARDYLARIAVAFPIYIALYEDAMALLPPPRTVVGPQERLEAHIRVRELTAKFPLSEYMVKRELARLANYGWIGAMAPRLLGHRVGSTVFLMADMAAEDATQEVGLVTRSVLKTQAPQVEKPVPATGRGLSRKWEKP